MDWNDLRYFLSVTRTGSLTGAAAALHVSQSTVSRRITALEESLGTQLFVRHATGYFLTDRGQDVLRRAQAVEDSIMALEKGLTGLDNSASGVVRLATAETLAVSLIIPALPEFSARYPHLRLEIITSTDMVDLPRYEADLALRLVRPSHGNLVIQKLGSMASAVYGSVDYLRQHPPAENPPVGGRRFVVWDKSFAHLPSATWLAERAYDLNPALVTTSVAAQYAAVKAGIGLALLPCFLAAENDDLIQVIPSEQVFSEDLWLVTQADLRQSLRIRVVAEFLKVLLARHQSAFSDFG